jgi:CBS domain-containing protein
MNAVDVMTRSVVSIPPDASIREAAGLMLEHKVSGLPVVDARGNLVGIVTEGDFLRRAEIGAQTRRPHWIEFFTDVGQLAGEYVRASGRKVQDVMSRQVRTVSEETPLAKIARLMEQHGIKRVPVMRGQELVGIVTRANLLGAVIAPDLDAPRPPVDDAEIHGRLLDELKKQPWAVPLSMVRFTVKNGAVDFDGVVRDEKQKQALRVAAENIRGVRTITDHRVRVEPVLSMFAKE